MSQPDPPAAATEVFGSALPLATRYAGWLAGAGVTRGLVGPREVSRLWDRHLLNCAGVAGLLPPAGATGVDVVDIGSGAGLPGIVVALLRPDLSILLLDATRRRIEFLTEVVRDLELDRVTTRWGRAEELAGTGLAAATATARAVAPLEQLAGWALPLLRGGGQLLALKGVRAAAELRDAQPALRRLGGDRGEILDIGTGGLHQSATVVRVRLIGPARQAAGSTRRGRDAAGRRGRTREWTRDR